MATKKKTSNFKEVMTRSGNYRYRLTDTVMVEINRTTGRLQKYGHFMARGEMQRVLTQVYLTGVNGEATTYYAQNGRITPFRARRDGDDLRIGCNTFSKTQVRKLARWTGVRIEQ